MSAERPLRRRRKTERVEGARHGTTTGYTADACRCDDCFGAMRAYQDRYFDREGGDAS